MDKEILPPAESSAAILPPAENKSRTQGLLQGLSKLRVLLPVASGALRMVDHGAVQALARLLPLLEGGAPPAHGAEEVQQGFADMQQDNSDLRTRVQAQTSQMKRLEAQIELLREAEERQTGRHFALVEDVKSLRALVRRLGIALLLLLAILIGLAAYLVAR